MRQIRIAGVCAVLTASCMVFGCSGNPGSSLAAGPSASGGSLAVPAGQHYSSTGVLVPDDQTAQAMPGPSGAPAQVGPTSGPPIGPVGNRPPTGAPH